MIGVVHKVRFVSSGDSKFNKYIDYIDRNEAARNYKFEEFSLYNNYMDNPEKSGSLFTDNRDHLTKEELENLKDIFEKAQANKSMMWQDVFSFDNEWLEKQGLYNPKEHSVDEIKIRKAIRASMNELIKKEGFENLTYSASLHYNTDNIHVHVASVEINPTRDRGKRKPKTLINMKSKFANNLMDRSEELKKINYIIRDNLIDGQKKFGIKKDKEIKKLVQEVISKLPKDKRQWSYNYNSIQDVKPLLDNITKYYIGNYKEEEFKELEGMLDKEELVLKETYGEGETFRYKDYKKNKIDDLYTRMGNTLLKEIKADVKLEDNNRRLNAESNSHINRSYVGDIINFNQKDINRIKKAIGNDFDSMKNQNAYERLQRKIENDRGY
ncbi:MAG: MobP2 family relaxase [Cetobacterium sp.]|uniref:MobP2 family relaxase n=1 Tax=Bacteria TaxID=2 RepID=UPI002FC7DAEC